jgi:ABC-type transporter Mla maintaining outer membrane lipid asymmetry ATPase subunit MlaF
MIEGPYSNLSGGWKSRCALASALLMGSDVLLLDEPSNFLVSLALSETRNLDYHPLIRISLPHYGLKNTS